MYKVEDYTPKEMIFTAETNAVPQSLGKFKTEEEARTFMEENLMAIQTRHTAARHMDRVEVEILRDRYTEELEDVLPGLRKTYFKKARELEAAKREKKEAKEKINASLKKIQRMADKVNEGITEAELDFANTWKLIYNGKKYFYTYINGEIKLADVQDISGYEINDLTGNSKKNEAFFERSEQVVLNGEK